MKKLDKIYFLIHGLCFAALKFVSPEKISEPLFNKCFERENKCAEKWINRISNFLPGEALVYIPIRRGVIGGPVDEFIELAASIIGDRLFVFDRDYKSVDDLLKILPGSLDPGILKPAPGCNGEETGTFYHSVILCSQFEEMLRERGYSFDNKNVSAEAWGASFDGCVTKYSLSIRKILGLNKIISIEYGMTIPDAFFILKPMEAETVLPDNGIRLFIFHTDGQTIALYTFTEHSPKDKAACVKLRLNKDTVVNSKLGLRLWPDPEPYILKNVRAECRELPREVVGFKDGRLHVPVSAGFTYRLAKAPAYIFAPAGMKRNEFKDILIKAKN